MTDEPIYPYGTRVRSTSEGPLGVFDTDSPRPSFLEDVHVVAGDVGSVTAPDGVLPDGWLLVEFDGKGFAPVTPDWLEVIE